MSLQNYLGSELHLQGLAELRCLYVFQGPDVDCPRGLPGRVTPARERLPEAMRLRQHHKWPVGGDTTDIKGPVSERSLATGHLPESQEVIPEDHVQTQMWKET